MYRKKTTAFLVSICLLMALFAGCVGSESAVDAIEQVAQEINESSTLPMALLTPKFDIDGSYYEEYIPNFMSFDYYGNDFMIRFCGFPTDEDDFFLTDITWTCIDYDLFGIKIGDELIKAADTLKSWGYVHTGGNYIQEFEKDGVVLELSGQELVEEIAIHIPSEYTSGNLY